MRKIIIDTDPGVDDAFAIIAALSYSDFELLGITSVAGNKSIESTTNNALRVLKLMNSDVKVYQGAKYPLGVTIDIEFECDVHGENGLGETNLEVSDSNLEIEEASDFIIRMAKKYGNELEIIALGPLTNVALAINKDRKSMESIKRIYTMGGGIYEGNLTPVAEFNYWFDPKSVELTYSIGSKVPIYMTGLDLTKKVILNLNDFYFINRELGKLGQILYKMSKEYIDVYWRDLRITGCVIHDLITVLFAIDDGKIFPKSGIYHTNLQISKEGITKGQTVVDFQNILKLEKNAYVVMDVDEDKCKELFIKLLDESKLDLYIRHIINK